MGKATEGPVENGMLAGAARAWDELCHPAGACACPNCGDLWRRDGPEGCWEGGRLQSAYYGFPRSDSYEKAFSASGALCWHCVTGRAAAAHREAFLTEERLWDEAFCYLCGLRRWTWVDGHAVTLLLEGMKAHAPAEYACFLDDYLHDEQRLAFDQYLMDRL